MSYATSPPKRFKGCAIRASAGGSFPSNVVTVVPFNTVEFETFNFWDASNPERLTIPQGVKKVRLSINISMNNAAASSPKYMVYKNNSSAWPARIFSQDSDSSYCSASTVVDVVAGDYFDVRILQSSGSVRYLASTLDNVFFIEGLE